MPEQDFILGSDHGKTLLGGLNLPTHLGTLNVLGIMSTDATEVSTGSVKKGTPKVKPTSNSSLLKLSGKSDPRTRRENQKLLRRALRRIRSRVKDLKNYRHQITIK